MGSRNRWTCAVVLTGLLHCILVGGFRFDSTDGRSHVVDEKADLHGSVADTGLRDLLQANERKVEHAGGGERTFEGTESNQNEALKSEGEVERPKKILEDKSARQSFDLDGLHKKHNSQASTSAKHHTKTKEAGEQSGTEHEETAGGKERKANEGKQDASKEKPANVQEQRQPPKVELFRTLKKPEPKGDEGMREVEQEATEEAPFDYPEPYLLGPTIKDWDEQRGDWLEANPQMKSTSKGKPRVLIVTGSIPEPCPSPTGDNFHIKSLKLKIDYARIHKYEIYYNLVHLDPLFDKFWVKLPTIRKLMLTHPEIEWFFWVDSDAVFTDMLFEAPWDTYEGYNMVMWGSESGLLKDKSWVAYNAGVFLLRNCQWSLDLIDKWSPFGPNGPVRVQYGKVFSSFLTWRADDFPADDQSALAYLFINDEAVRSKVKLVKSKYMMSGFWLSVVDTYEELMEKYHPGLGDARWPWITHFTGCGPCAGGDNPDYSIDKCMQTFGKAYNFADNQVLAYMGFRHESLVVANVVRTRNDTDRPLDFVDANPWADRIAATKSLES